MCFAAIPKLHVPVRGNIRTYGTQAEKCRAASTGRRLYCLWRMPYSGLVSCMDTGQMGVLPGRRGRTHKSSNGKVVLFLFIAHATGN